MIQNLLQPLLPPTRNSAINARLPGAYPRSMTTETESTTYYSTLDYISDSEIDDTGSEYGLDPIIDVRVWKDFLADHEIGRMFESNSLSRALDRTLTSKEIINLNEGIRSEVNEFTFLSQWEDQLRLINTAIYLCACDVQATKNPSYVTIRFQPQASQHGFGKWFPDFFAYPEGNQFDSAVVNRIPGDLRSFRAVRHSMLSPNGEDRNSETDMIAQRCFRQIHDFMNQLGVRYSYIVNKKEIIMLRRIGWRRLEISEAIRHNVQFDMDRGIWNSKIVLFYFHWIVANDDALWRFKTYTQRNRKAFKLRHV